MISNTLVQNVLHKMDLHDDALNINIGDSIQEMVENWRKNNEDVCCVYGLICVLKNIATELGELRRFMRWTNT